MPRKLQARSVAGGVVSVASEPKFPEVCQDRALRKQLHQLASGVRKREVILFVGGGISQNLGLPNFSELIQHLAHEMHLDVNDFKLSDYPVLAEAYLKSSGDFTQSR